MTTPEDLAKYLARLSELHKLQQKLGLGGATTQQVKIGPGLADLADVPPNAELPWIDPDQFGNDFTARDNAAHHNAIALLGPLLR